MELWWCNRHVDKGQLVAFYWQLLNKWLLGGKATHLSDCLDLSIFVFTMGILENIFFVLKVVFLLLAGGSVVLTISRDRSAAASLLQMPRRGAVGQTPRSWRRLELHLPIFITGGDRLSLCWAQEDFFTSQQCGLLPWGYHYTVMFGSASMLSASVASLASSFS